MSKDSERIMKTQRKKKINAVNAFGGKCSICGYDKCMGALEFHHLDKKVKENHPAYIVTRWSFKRAKKELEKCILVCANCHREIHFKEKEGMSLELLNYVKPWLDLKCEYCRKEFSTKDENQKFCGHNCMHYAQRKVTNPSKEELSSLMKTTNWTQLGRMFGVSDNAVRKWAKKYELI